jgi:hypothetical protein
MAADEQGIDVVTSKTVGYSKSLMAALSAADAPTGKLTGALGEAANATGKLNLQTAGATQEYIRLGHEALTGNFSRIPGSLIVLASRLGGIGEIIGSITPLMVGAGAAAAATAAAFIEWAVSTEEMTTAQIHLKNAMDLAGNSASYNANRVAEQVVALRMLGDMSTSTAEKVLTIAASGHNMSEQLRNSLLSILPDFAAKTNQEAPKAMEELVKLFENPKTGAVELAETMNGVLSAAQLNAIQDSIKAGKTIDAQAKMFDALAKAVQGASEQLSAWDKFWKQVHTGVVGITNPITASSVAGDPKNQLPLQTPQQQDAAKQQQEQQALNQQELAGLETVKEVHGEQTEINRLLDERKALVISINAASQLKSKANDSGDSDAEKQQEALLQKYQASVTDVDQKITNVHQQEAKERINISMQEYDEEVKGLQKLITQNAETLQAQVDLHQITKQQEIAQEAAFVDSHYQMMIQDKENELNILGLTLQERQKINNEIVDMQAELQSKLLALRVKETQEEERANQEQVQKYQQLIDQIGGKFDTIIGGVLQGTQTWKQAFLKLYDDLGIITSEFIAKITAEWAASKIFGAGGLNLPNIAEATSGKGTLFGSITGAGKTGSDTAQTTAVTANTGALTTLNANIAALMTSLGVNTSQVDAHTVATTSGTVATTANTSTQSTGILATIENTLAGAENTLATEINTIWLELKAAFPFLQEGTTFAQGGMSILHPGEIVIPPAQSAQIRAGGILNGGSAGVSGGGGGSVINFNVSAVDGQSVANLFKSNGAAIASVMQTLTRNNNQSIKNAAMA